MFIHNAYSVQQTANFENCFHEIIAYITIGYIGYFPHDIIVAIGLPILL